MEDILNKLINLDNNAKNKIKELQDKEENIESYINEKLKTEKSKIDAIYQYKKNSIVDQFDTKFEEEKQKYDENTAKQIKELQEKYNKEKNIMLANLINSIILQNKNT